MSLLWANAPEIAKSITADIATNPCKETSIPQRLPRLQRVLYPLLRLPLAAQRFESLALQIQQILLAHRRSRCHIAAAQHLGHLVADLLLMVADVLALPHQMHAQLE